MNDKNTATKQWLKIIGLIAIGIIFTIFVSIFFDTCKVIPKSPNTELIKELERQRLHIDSMANAALQMVEKYRAAVLERQHRDSMKWLLLQDQIIQTIKTIKPLYEKIPSYQHADNDSLRRLLSERFP